MAFIARLEMITGHILIMHNHMFHAIFVKFLLCADVCLCVCACDMTKTECHDTRCCCGIGGAEPRCVHV